LTDFSKTELKLRSLVIFRRLLDNDVFQKLSVLLQAEGLSASEQVSRYADFAAALFAHGTNLTVYVWNCIIGDDNIYVKKYAQKQPIDNVLKTCMKNELVVLEAVAQLKSADIRAHIRFDGFLPDWQTSDMDFAAMYASHMDGIATEGHGIYAKHHMLRLRNGDIVPVTCPDPIRLADLKEYERQKRAVVGNTLALLDGKPAANALLYGDAGTGKSSTVKAKHFARARSNSFCSSTTSSSHSRTTTSTH
jgi:hypothetical protein